MLDFQRVNNPPVTPQPGTVYFVRRGVDGDELDLMVADADGDLVRHHVQPAQMLIDSSPGLLPADTIFMPRYLVTADLELLADESAVVADVAATNSSAIRVLVGATLVARATFAAGQAQAAIEILQPVIPSGSLMIFRSPLVQDPTLSGVSGTFAARRI